MVKLLILDELGYVPFMAVGSELLFEVFSQRYARGATLVTSNLPFDEWTVFGSERLTGALLDRPWRSTAKASGSQQVKRPNADQGLNASAKTPHQRVGG